MNIFSLVAAFSPEARKRYESVDALLKARGVDSPSSFNALLREIGAPKVLCEMMLRNPYAYLPHAVEEIAGAIESGRLPEENK